MNNNLNNNRSPKKVENIIIHKLGKNIKFSK